MAGRIEAGEGDFVFHQSRNREVPWERAERDARNAESRRLAALSDAVRLERLDLAMLLALEAAERETPSKLGRACNARSTARPEVVRFLHVPEGKVSSVAFGPDGKIAAGYGGVGGVVVFDARGERLRTASLEVKEGYVTSVAFGPEGKIAAGYRGVIGSGVVVFDARGERLRPAPLEIKEGYVNSVAFGPEGKIAAGYAIGGGFIGSGVVVFDARGERLRPAPLEVTEGYVNSVAFGPEGQIAAGYSSAPSAASAAWWSSTPVASGSDPHRWRSRRALSEAWPSGRRARSPRDMAAPSASAARRRRGGLRRPWRAAPTRAAGGQGGRC